MPTLNIEGRNVQVDDSFLKLPPDQQNATVDEIAKSFNAPTTFAERFDATPKEPQPTIASAVTDIPKEVKSAAIGALQDITRGSIPNQPGYDPRTRAELGTIEALGKAGKQVLGIPELLAALPTGVARSVIGHLMTQGEHWVGSIIAPQIAARDDLAKMYETSKADVDTALSASRPGIAKGVPAPSIQELEAAYKAVRNSPEVKGATVPIENVKNLAATAEQELLARGDRPTTGSAPRTFNEVRDLAPSPPPEPTPQQKLQAEMNWEPIPEPPKVADATVDDLLAAKRAFGQIAKERQPFPSTKATPDAAAANSVIPELDNLIEQAAPGMKEANANYSRAQLAAALDKTIQKKEMRAATNNSGLNIGNQIRQGVDTFLNSAGSRSLKPEERILLEQVAYGTPTRNAIRYASNLLGGGGLGAAVTGDIASRSPLGAMGWLAAPLGHALKHIENNLTVSAAKKVSEAIRSNSPLGKAIQNSAQKWNDAFASYAKARTPAKAAALSLMSRNLANTLSSAGAKINPADLLRSIPSPSTNQAAE